jgi:GDPmannose 4,6-dehydratase
MCDGMVAEDLKVARRHRLLRDNGLDLPISQEG